MPWLVETQVLILPCFLLSVCCCPLRDYRQLDHSKRSLGISKPRRAVEWKLRCNAIIWVQGQQYWNKRRLVTKLHSNLRALWRWSQLVTKEYFWLWRRIEWWRASCLYSGDLHGYKSRKRDQYWIRLAIWRDAARIVYNQWRVRKRKNKSWRHTWYFNRYRKSSHNYNSSVQHSRRRTRVAIDRQALRSICGTFILQSVVNGGQWRLWEISISPKSR